MNIQRKCEEKIEWKITMSITICHITPYAHGDTNNEILTKNFIFQK